MKRLSPSPKTHLKRIASTEDKLLKMVGVFGNGGLGAVVKSGMGSLYTVIVNVVSCIRLHVPGLLARSRMVYVPGFWYRCVGFSNVDVLSGDPKSPKSHSQETAFSDPLLICAVYGAQPDPGVSMIAFTFSAILIVNALSSGLLQKDVSFRMRRAW